MTFFRCFGFSVVVAVTISQEPEMSTIRISFDISIKKQYIIYKENIHLNFMNKL